MFESLSDRLQDVFRQIRGDARLTEQSVETALREIRMALLEADVNFKVVKAFIDRVRDRAVGEDVLKSLTPAQQVVAIVRDEMLALFGDAKGGLPPSTVSPRVILLLGLQGSGKTTTSAKLARLLTREGRHPIMVSTDVRRPAAIKQLGVLGEQLKVRVHDPEGELDPVVRASGAMAAARNLGFDTVIVDTAGRLQNKRELMDELAKIRRVLGRLNPAAPHDVVLVLDATTGQNALSQIEVFKEVAGVTGLVMTKLDGTARGGVLVAAAEQYGLPIHAIGVGEKVDDLRPFDA
ncbi:MAG: signal recognition particle receptor subunit alpha, partial [Microvirga sp.]